jgi:hypothetical protein
MDHRTLSARQLSDTRALHRIWPSGGILTDFGIVHLESSKHSQYWDMYNYGAYLTFCSH